MRLIPSNCVVLTFFLIVCSPDTKAFGLHGALDVISVTKDVVVWIAKAWNIVDGHVDFGDIPPPLLNKKEARLFAKLDTITGALNNLKEQVDAIGTSTITMILANLPDRIKTELKLNDLQGYISFIDIYYYNMQKYVVHREDIEKSTLKDFADAVVSHDTSSVAHMIEKVYTYVVPTRSGIVSTGILPLISKNLRIRSMSQKKSGEGVPWSKPVPKPAGIVNHTKFLGGHNTEELIAEELVANGRKSFVLHNDSRQESIYLNDSDSSSSSSPTGKQEQPADVESVN